jgi:hypothetical protein
MYMRYKNNRAVYGGVVLRVIICVASLLVLGVAIAVTLKTFAARKADDYRKAETLQAYGFQMALEKLGESRDWNTGFTDDPYGDGGSFTVEFAREERGGVTYVKITSIGRSGSVSLPPETKEYPLPPEGAFESDGPEAADGESSDINVEHTVNEASE